MKCKAVIEFEITDESTPMRIVVPALESKISVDGRGYCEQAVMIEHVKVLSIALGTQSVAQELPT